MPRRRRTKPIPAALAMTLAFRITEDGRVESYERPLLEQLSPRDALRMRHVMDDPDVQEAARLVKEAYAREKESRSRMAESPAAVAEHRQHLRYWEILRDEMLDPAILKAEKKRARRLAWAPATPAELDANLAVKFAPGMRRSERLEVMGDRLLAIALLLERHPNWRDPHFWVAPDTRPYIAKAVFTESRFLGKRRRGADQLNHLGAKLRTRLPDPDSVEKLPSRKYSPDRLLEVKQARAMAKHARRSRRGLLRALRRTVPDDLRQIIDEMKAACCGPYEAARHLGIPRSRAVSLLARANRLKRRCKA